MLCITNMYNTLHNYYMYKQKYIIMYEIKLLKLNNCKNSICCTKSNNSGIKYVIHQFLEKECRGWTSFF